MGQFEPIAALGSFWVFVINVAVTIVGGLLAIAIIVKLLRHLLKKSNHADDAMSVFVVNAIRGGCFVVLITMVLQLFGVGMSTIVAVLGAAGAAIALALKDSLSNIAGGFMILFNHPFNKGDLITVGTERGVVEEIDLFLTKLRTLDYKTVTIPNGLINTSVIYNESNRPIRRMECQFSVSYDTDLEKTKSIIQKVCDDADLILQDPAPIIGVADHGDSAVVFDVFTFVNTDDLVPAGYYLKQKVKEAFDAEGIEIPYPHMDVNINQ